MEVVKFDEVEDDSTLSWAQLAGCALCCLCCYGVGTAMVRGSRLIWARFWTTWQGVAPKLKEKIQEKDSPQIQVPSLVRDQSAQTDQGTYFGSSPKPRQLDTPRKAVRKNILLDMAQRAQPVIQEVEARKHRSTQSRENPAQGETC